MPPRYGRRTLTPGDAVEICRLRALGVRVNQLARRFGVTHGTVSHILTGDAWQDAETPRPVLTERQRQIVRLLAEGYTTHAIAGRLGIVTGSVHRHLERIAERYDLEPDPERTLATQVVIEAARRGDLKER